MWRLCPLPSRSLSRVSAGLGWQPVAPRGARTQCARAALDRLVRSLFVTIAKHTWTDNAKEIFKALGIINILYDTTAPHWAETNGVIERAILRVKRAPLHVLFSLDSTNRGGIVRCSAIASYAITLTFYLMARLHRRKDLTVTSTA